MNFTSHHHPAFTRLSPRVHASRHKACPWQLRGEAQALDSQRDGKNSPERIL